LRRCLKTVNDVDEVTLDSRLFHTREVATGKARSPMVEWRISGTTSVDVDVDLNHRRESVRHSVEFNGKIWRSHRIQTTVCEHCQLEINPLRHSQPVKVTEQQNDGLMISG